MVFPSFDSFGRVAPREREQIAKARVSSKNQISIPRAIAEELDLAKGDYLLFLRDGEDIVVRKGRVVPE